MSPGNERKFRDQLIVAARSMRRDPTASEKLLWNRICKLQLAGVKFRRQHIIHSFIVDFYCSQKRLVVEIDGEIHLGQVEYDKERDKMLRKLGYEILRFKNQQVVNQHDQVLEAIHNNIS